MDTRIPPFQDTRLFTTALTHRSALNEHISAASESNERLEFLGDAVLELITTRFLFDKFPETQEGLLTAYRSSLVKTQTLAQVAKKIGLDQLLLISKGEEATGGRDNEGLLADGFEAIIGALYLDQGIDAARGFLERELFVEFEAIHKNKLYKDAKSQLQEVVQSQGDATPQYVITGQHGPDHEKIFTVDVLVQNKVVGTGSGSSKQRAQRQAARSALEAISAQVDDADGEDQADTTS